LTQHVSSEFSIKLLQVGSFLISIVSLCTIDKCISNIIFLSNCSEHLVQYMSIEAILVT
jgi:hypothetical protein